MRQRPAPSLLSNSTIATNAGSFIGQSGTGNLNVAGGSSFSSFSGGVHIGENAGSIGTATIQGSTSSITANSDDIRVGVNGTGNLNIETGGLAQASNNIHVGRFSGGTGIATVTGAGSKLMAGTDGSGVMFVGNEGSGTLNVYDGGVADSALDVRVGFAAGSVGQVTVGGNGSVLSCRNGERRPISMSVPTAPAI